MRQRIVNSSFALIAGMALAHAVAPASAAGLPPVQTSTANGMPRCATPGRLMAFLYERNPGLDQRYRDIAALYITIGQELGIRSDYAFFQMLVETGNLTFTHGDGKPGAVDARQNNLAGLGAAGPGQSGESFPDLATGIRAHLQHLLMYAGQHIDQPVAERTRKVQSWGVLTAWHKSLGHAVSFDEVTRRWATDPSYTASIEAIGHRFYQRYCVDTGPAAPMATTAAAAPGQAVRQASLPAPASRAADAPNEPPHVSGAELARAAVERARAEDDGARSALGYAPIDGGAARIDRRPALAMRQPQTVIESMPGSSVMPEPQSPPGAPRAEPVPRQAAPTASAQSSVARTEPNDATTAAPKVAVAVVHPAVVAPVNPADEAIRTLVSGKTFVLDAPMGYTIPIAFHTNGTIHGNAGGLASYLGAAVDQGRWWVARGRLCQRWNQWFDRVTQCLTLRQSGPVIHWVSDSGKSGTARIASR